MKTRRIAPGLLYTKIVERKIPRRTFILSMDPSKAVTLDVALAGGALPAGRELSRIVNFNDALAGINGDYGISRPVHAMMQDGELVQTTAQAASLFAISADETQTFVGPPTVRVTMTDQATGTAFHVDRWNDGAALPGEIAGFTPLGGSLELPPEFSCSVRLLPSGPLQLAQTDGVNRDFTVDASGCSEARTGTQRRGSSSRRRRRPTRRSSSWPSRSGRRSACTGRSAGPACSTPSVARR